MQQLPDHAGIPRELPYNTVAPCVPPVHPRLCGASEKPGQQQQQPLNPDRRTSGGPHEIAAVATAGAAPHQLSGKFALPPHKQQQRHNQTILPFATEQTESSRWQLGLTGLVAHATSSWTTGPHPTPTGGPASTVRQDKSTSCFRNVTLPALLPAASTERSLQFRQEADFASPGRPNAAEGWSRLQEPNVRPSVPPWAQFAASAPAAAVELASTGPAPKRAMATGTVIRSPAEGGAIGGGMVSLQQPQEKQVLLRQLHQNQQMQQEILRSLQQQQQQQQRWRHLLEACDSGGVAETGADSRPSDPEPDSMSHVLLPPDIVSIQQQAREPTAAPFVAPQACPAAAPSSGARRRRPQFLGRQAWAHTEHANPPVQGSLWVPYDASASQRTMAADSGTWGLAPPADAESLAASLPSARGPQEEVSGGQDEGRMLQPSNAWRLSATPGCSLRGTVVPLTVGSLPGGTAQAPSTRAVSVAMEVHASAPGAASSAPGCEETDAEPFIRPSESFRNATATRRKPPVGRRRGGRNVQSRRGGTRSQLSVAAAPHPCSSKSASVARAASCAVLGFGSGMPLQTKLAEAPAIGLVNLGGGSCFLNVVLQCLAHMQPLRDFYLHYEAMLPPSDLLGSQYEAYTSYLEASRQHVRRLKRGPHQLIPTPTYTTSVTWELAVVINHMWKSPSSVRFLKPEALYQVCCRIMPDFDPREMQDSDEFLRLLLDFLDGELRAAATGIPLHKALMMQAMPRKLGHWPSCRFQRSERASNALPSQSDNQTVCRATNAQELEAAPEQPPSAQEALPGFAELPTLFSIFFEGAEVDKVRCTRCGRCTATLVPFKSLAVAMTQEAQDESCQHASLKVKPASFFHLLTKVDLVECLNRHFADDCDSLKLSSGEGYFCEQCNSKQDAVKSCSLVKDHLPFILCLTLKRFVRGKETYKIWNPVHFDDFVDLSRYVECTSDTDPLPAGTAGPKIKPAGELLHHGPLCTAQPSPEYVHLSVEASSASSICEGLASPTRSFTVEEATAKTENSGQFLVEEEGASVAAASAKGHPTEGALHCTVEDPPAGSTSDVSAHNFSKYIYKLVALVEHEGPATEQGHYVCYVKHMGCDAWFRADDKVVEQVDLQRVLAACPYILFYQRLPESAESGNPRLAASPMEGQHQSSQATGRICPGTNSVFAGLREQLEIAKGLSQGQWRQWQNSVVGLASTPEGPPKTGDRFLAEDIEMTLPRPGMQVKDLLCEENSVRSSIAIHGKLP